MTKQPPDIAALNARLARQNRRVQSKLDELIGQLDCLVDAALAGDWEGVRRWSVEISQCGKTHEDPEILESAQLLVEAADRADNEAELKRHVMRLIAACGKSQSGAKMP
jgi:hypothetical protein